MRGCIIGGAVGDALGAPVEFFSMREIRQTFGEEGIQEYAPAYGRDGGAITDDTQMTLFTAEGLLRSAIPRDTVGEVRKSYLDWYRTQMGGKADGVRGARGLLAKPGLWARRAPGNTCMAAMAMWVRGQVPKNDSPGCGTVMRVAPVGLLFRDAFDLGEETGAITHGGEGAQYAAGFFAQLISYLLDRPLYTLVDCIHAVSREHYSEKFTPVLQRAVDLADEGSCTPERIEGLGGGWTAMEALAISLYVALSVSGFEEAVRAAVNHGGDSDSTGSMVGQIKGVVRGVEAIPERWVHCLEMVDVIDGMAMKIARARRR